MLFLLVLQHERYNMEPGTFSNDIAILTLLEPFTIEGNVQVATLPPDNSYSFEGDSCVISGWGITCKCLCTASYMRPYCCMRTCERFCKSLGDIYLKLGSTRCMLLQHIFSLNLLLSTCYRSITSILFNREQPMRNL